MFSKERLVFLYCRQQAKSKHVENESNWLDGLPSQREWMDALFRVLDPVLMVMNRYYDFAYGNRVNWYAGQSYTRKMYDWLVLKVKEWREGQGNWNWSWMIFVAGLVVLGWRIVFAFWRYRRGEIQSFVSQVPAFVQETSLNDYKRDVKQRLNARPKDNQHFYSDFPSERRSALEFDQNGRVQGLKPFASPNNISSVNVLQQNNYQSNYYQPQQNNYQSNYYQPQQNNYYQSQMYSQSNTYDNGGYQAGFR